MKICRNFPSDRSFLTMRTAMSPSRHSVRPLFLSLSSGLFPERSGSDLVNVEPAVLLACSALYQTADPSLNTCMYCQTQMPTRALFYGQPLPLLLGHRICPNSLRGTRFP